MPLCFKHAAHSHATCWSRRISSSSAPHLPGPGDSRNTRSVASIDSITAGSFISSSVKRQTWPAAWIGDVAR
ncbi:MAG: hypothetical protein JXR37_28640 [Kiritimatiellae bacterium]|nr:hypothetical protein [Kiritimatiellia bacterium]